MYLTFKNEGKLYLDSNFIGIGVNLGIHKIINKKYIFKSLNLYV
jgi:hypothetical protein